MLFKDRLEIWSPGPLPKGMTLAKFYKRHKSYPANPFLAFALFLRKYIEQTGTGAKDMIARCEKNGLPKPVWKIEDGDDFRVVIRRPAEVAAKDNGGDNRGDNRGDNQLASLPDEQRRICEKLKENPSISIRKLAEDGIRKNSVDKQVSALKSKGFVVRRGGTRGAWEVRT